MSNTSKNADMPAMPMGKSHTGAYFTAHDLGDGYVEQCKPAFGLTKREEFAKTAMIGLLSNPSMIDSVTNVSIDFIVDASILIADKILTDLEKQQ